MIKIANEIMLYFAICRLHTDTHMQSSHGTGGITAWLLLVFKPEAHGIQVLENMKNKSLYGVSG